MGWFHARATARRVRHAAARARISPGGAGRGPRPFVAKPPPGRLHFPATHEGQAGHGAAQGRPGREQGLRALVAIDASHEITDRRVTDDPSGTASATTGSARPPRHALRKTRGRGARRGAQRGRCTIRDGWRASGAATRLRPAPRGTQQRMCARHAPTALSSSK